VFKLTLKGNKAVLKGLEKVRKESIKKIEQEVGESADQIRNGAVTNAPVNDGFLKGSISVQKDKLNARIEVGANYGAYIEFGTGMKVQVPAGLEDYARSFQDKGQGNWQEFEQNMIQWLKKKGIEEEALYPIMASIYRNGINAKPFLFPAFEAERPQLVKRIKNILADSTK
jgi:HK97 gp10 family phage protein